MPQISVLLVGYKGANKTGAEAQQASVDLILQPAVAGRPKPVKEGDIAFFDSMIRRCASYHARMLGVPLALVDRTGQINTQLPAGFGGCHSTFPGCSQIVRSKGAIVALERKRWQNPLLQQDVGVPLALVCIHLARHPENGRGRLCGKSATKTGSHCSSET